MIGIIGGSGVEEISEFADSIETRIVETEYGSVEVSLLTIEDKTVAFIPSIYSLEFSTGTNN